MNLETLVKEKQKFEARKTEAINLKEVAEALSNSPVNPSDRNASVRARVRTKANADGTFSAQVDGIHVCNFKSTVG